MHSFEYERKDLTFRKSAHTYERVTPLVPIHARASCIMELCRAIYFESFGVAGAQDDVHVTQLWKTINTSMPVPVCSCF